MAFWGAILKPKGKHTLKDVEDGDILHLSQACMKDPKPGKCLVEVKDEDSTFSLAVLEKDKCEHCTFDLFFDKKSVTFFNKGDSEVHLTGYFEPADDGMEGEDDEDEDEDEDEDDEDAPAPKALAKTGSPKALGKPGSPGQKPGSPAQKPGSPAQKPQSPLQKAQANAQKNVGKAQEEADDDEDEDEDDDEEGDDEDDDEEEGDDDDEEDDEDEEDEKEEPAPKKDAKAGGPGPAQVQAGLKRKGEAGGAAEANGTAKKAKAGGGGAAAAEDYVNRLKDYLKKNGKSPLSLLGSKVQRPDTVPKLGKVLAEHKNLFKVENGDVTLIGK